MNNIKSISAYLSIHKSSLIFANVHYCSKMFTIVHQTGEKITIARSRDASHYRGLKTQEIPHVMSGVVNIDAS